MTGKTVSDESDDSDEWEAVENAKLADEDEQLPTAFAPVEVDVPLDGSTRKRKTLDPEALLLARIAKREKELNIEIHKVHLLCCLSHGFYLNDTIGHNTDLLGTALSQWNMSVIQRICQNLDPIELDARRLQLLVASIKSRFPLESEKDDVTDDTTTIADLQRSLSFKRCSSYLHQVLIIILMLRCLGLDVRLIYSMQPRPSLKTVQENSLPRKYKDVINSPYFDKSCAKPETRNKSSATKVAVPNTIVKRKDGSASKRSDQSAYPDVDEDVEPAAKKRRPSALTSPTTSPRKPTTAVEQNCGPSSETSSPRTTPSKVKVANHSFTNGIDYWLDVYCSKIKSYVPVSQSGAVNQYEKCEKSASQPVHYVVAFGESNEAKDITGKFSTEWLTMNRKLQVGSDWWKKTLRIFRPRDLLRDAEEDDAIRGLLRKRPLPKSVQEYKGHPLYVLERHLLKYEALYPPNPVPVHNIKGEPVYLEELVHQLRTRENWLKEARVVKMGETPYKEVRKAKRVTAAKKATQLALLMGIHSTQSTVNEESSGLFGRWQTEDYIPPVAKDVSIKQLTDGSLVFHFPV